MELLHYNFSKFMVLMKIRHTAQKQQNDKTMTKLKTKFLQP